MLPEAKWLWFFLPEVVNPCYGRLMETALNIDVAALDTPHRRALEEIVGHELATHQRLIISVIEIDPSPVAGQPAQTLDDWTTVYDGLNDEDIEAIDVIAKTRADLSRPFP